MNLILRLAARLALLGVLLAANGIADRAIARDITAAGQKLARTLDSLQVESRWIAGVHVNWETGLPDGKPEHSPGKHTHCSAFVASAAKLLGVYILRPPQHGQVLLANAQYDWLASEDGAAQGWRFLKSGEEAQEQANRGQLVVATYHNHHDDKPGHIAIVRPSQKSREAIAQEGPDIIQAGGHNYSVASAKQGFEGHPSAWKYNEILYYAHNIEEAAR